jgi:hypothetical protein
VRRFIIAATSWLAGWRDGKPDERRQQDCQQARYDAGQYTPSDMIPIRQRAAEALSLEPPVITTATATFAGDLYGGLDGT